MPGLVWFMLAATVLVNLALVVAYNLQVVAPHGRLLFPTLIASGVLFARALCVISGNRRRVLAPLVCVLVLILGGLFFWTFVNRMAPAVAQQAENLVPLGVIPDGKTFDLGPIWGGTVQQPVLLPRGRLTGFRILIEGTSFLPQFGTVLHASLHRLPLATEDRGHAFKPFPMGDIDNVERWTEIGLETPLELSGMTPALLTLWAEKPWLSMPGSGISYQTTRLDRSPLLKPLIVDGKPTESGLALTAVYR